MKKTVSILLLCVTLLSLLPVGTFAADGEITVLFTHDTHDYLYPTTTVEGGTVIEHGGAAKLKTLIDRNTDENTVYLDGGDFAMGTLYQAAYSTDAYELRNLGLCGCAVTTFGNHEFDYGAAGAADMLRAAMSSGDPLPQIVQSNIVFPEPLTEDQLKLRDAMADYGVREYTVLEIGSCRVGIFGLAGLDCIECIQTDLSYVNYIEAAKKTVASLEEENCDIIIALSHAGTSGDGVNGEDFDLAKQVPGIDLIVSAHSHSEYASPVMVGDTAVVSAGEYLKKLGKIRLKVTGGKVSVAGYELIPIDGTVEEDPATAARMEEYKQAINNSYLKSEGVSFDDVVCHSNYDLIDLKEMYATHQEYTMGNIIADAYLYEARRNGINDIDVALVGLGTIRNSIKAGNITVADVFEICSLGVGADGSAGHPLVAAYITGEELKLLTELDASLGTLVSSIKMSYGGLEYQFNTKRLLLDRVTDVHLARADGSTEPIEDGKLYKVVANMYAINMLGMLNGLTKGILAITPKDASGAEITDFYAYSLHNTNGEEIKEWVALKNFLGSFEVGEHGVSELPEQYSRQLGRKDKIAVGGLAVIESTGAASRIMPGLLGVLAIAVTSIVYVIVLIRRERRPAREARKAQHKAAKAAKVSD